MKLHQLTPWARKSLSESDRATIEAAVPADYLVHIGRGQAGWTCRILSPRQVGVISEAYGERTPLIAFMAAWSKVPVA